MTLAKPLIERGIAVFVADMPGNGENIFSGNVKCRSHTVQLAFTKIVDVLVQRPDIKNDAIGTYGLCMGGGYAHYAASNDPRYKACATFFPLFITMVEKDSIPLWMRQGEGIKQQTGDIAPDDFMTEMEFLEQGSLSCSFLFIHGKYDNWMTLESATTLYDKATGHKEKIIIDEAPVFSNQQLVTHTMPVGEQLHWLKHVAADWMVKELHK